MKKQLLFSLVLAFCTASSLCAKCPCLSWAQAGFQCFQIAWKDSSNRPIHTVEELESFLDELTDGPEDDNDCTKGFNSRFDEKFIARCEDTCETAAWNYYSSLIDKPPSQDVLLGAISITFSQYMDTPSPPRTALLKLNSQAYNILKNTKDPLVLAVTLRMMKYYPMKSKKFIDLYLKLLNNDDPLVRELSFWTLNYKSIVELPFSPRGSLDERNKQLEAFQRWRKTLK